MGIPSGFPGDRPIPNARKCPILPGLLRHPFPCEALRFGYLPGRHRRGKIVAGMGAHGPHLSRGAGGGQVEPHVGKDRIPGHPFAVPAEKAQPVLRTGIALLGRHPVPFRGFRVVLGNPVALCIFPSQGDLGSDMALPGRPPEPYCRFRVTRYLPPSLRGLPRGGLPAVESLIGGPAGSFRGFSGVLGHSQAVRIQDSQVELGVGMPLLGCPPEPCRRFRVVLEGAFTLQVSPP